MVFVAGLGPGCVKGLSMRRSVAVSAASVKLPCILYQALCFHCHYCCWLSGRLRVFSPLIPKTLLHLYGEPFLPVGGDGGVTEDGRSSVSRFVALSFIKFLSFLAGETSGINRNCIYFAVFFCIE